MDSSSLNCIELGKLVWSSGLLHRSRSKISEIHANKDSGLEFKISTQGKLTFVVFAAPPICGNGSASTLLPVPGSQDPNPFHFLCSETSPISLHTPAFELFSSAYKDNLLDLKLELLKLLESKKLVIITGEALGGSVASLFTLWLLEKVEPGQQRPLCITFGSPLIGDASLQQVLEDSLRNSCFLHVPDAAKTPITPGFKPFGTFLICFKSGCICIEDPEAVIELLTGVNRDLIGWRNYGEIRDRKNQWLFSMADDSRLILDDVIKGMEERAEKKNLRFDLFKKLNDIKISMMHIEWYKKKSYDVKMGFYDRFKTEKTECEMDTEKRKKELNDYWDTVVKEVEKKPQSDTSILKTRFLLSGNNYRRMIEPLDIAEYYRDNRQMIGKEYVRPRRYVMLEKWFKDESSKPDRRDESRKPDRRDESRKPDRREGTDLSHLLTFDSCFWAKVEEAMIVISLMKTQEGMGDDVLMEQLMRFEKYVWEMIQKREVSPEIFLEKSSFMTWWKEYKKIKGRDGFNSSPSDFTEFMNTRKYQSYGLYIAG